MVFQHHGPRQKKLQIQEILSIKSKILGPTSLYKV